MVWFYHLRIHINARPFQLKYNITIPDCGLQIREIQQQKKNSHREFHF